MLFFMFGASAPCNNDELMSEIFECNLRKDSTQLFIEIFTDEWLPPSPNANWETEKVLLRFVWKETGRFVLQQSLEGEWNSLIIYDGRTVQIKGCGVWEEAFLHTLASPFSPFRRLEPYSNLPLTYYPAPDWGSYFVYPDNRTKEFQWRMEIISQVAFPHLWPLRNPYSTPTDNLRMKYTVESMEFRDKSFKNDLCASVSIVKLSHNVYMNGYASVIG